MRPHQRLLLAAALLSAGVYAVYARRAIRRFEDLDPQASDAPGSFVEIDGVRVHHVDAGAGDAVVLIHGWNASTFSFRYLIPELVRAGHRAVAIDLKGYGYSDRPRDGDYSLGAQAELVRRVMDRLGIARATVVGHSMGGSVAMRLALQVPERVDALVLVDSVPVGRVRRWAGMARLLAVLLPLLAPLTMHQPSFRMRALRSAMHDPAHVPPDVAEAYFRPFRMRGHFRSLAAQLRDRARDERLDPSSIRQPTLILWGEHDRWLPVVNGETLAAAIPNARLLPVRSAAHLPLEEQPVECNKAILEFLASLRKDETPPATARAEERPLVADSPIAAAEEQ